jgi:hypothetical protein
MTAQLTRGAVSAAAADDVSVDDLDLEIRALARAMSAQTYRLLMLVRAFDDRYGFAKWGLRNCAEWLAWRCGLSLSAAREKVRAAQALRELPAISAAFAEGRLSYTKVRALTRVAANHGEDVLLAYALDATAMQVEERCRQLRNAEPDSVHGARQVWERRSLTVFRDRARGCVRITVELPEADGQLVARALEKAVAAGDAAFGAEFAANPERSADAWRAQQADALVAIVQGYLSGGAGGEPSAEGAPSSAARPRSAPAADHYQVVLHVDAKSLRGGAGRSDLPVETMRRLTCDGGIVTVVEDEHGTPLDVGRKQRTVGTALRRALWSRDRGCVFPGCHNTRYVDAHHIHHWGNGGETSLDNTALLCKYHHTLVHEGGVTMHRDESDDFYFRRADGRVIPRSGYRAADMIDESIGAGGAEADRASVRGRMIAIMRGVEYCERDGAHGAHGAAEPSAEGRVHDDGAENPSAEVRETRGVYRIDRARASGRKRRRERSLDAH